MGAWIGEREERKDDDTPVLDGFANLDQVLDHATPFVSKESRARRRCLTQTGVWLQPDLALDRLRRQCPHAVRADPLVPRHDRQVVVQGLGDEHPVERIGVEVGERTGT